MKLLLLGIWSFSIATFFVGVESGIVTGGRIAFFILASLHLLECLLFLPLLRRSPGGLRLNLGLTFLFGLIHLGAVREMIEREEMLAQMKRQREEGSRGEAPAKSQASAVRTSDTNRPS